MKFTRDHGTLYLESDDGKLVISFINDWEQIFGKWNWYSWHLVYLYFEKDTMVGRSYELTFALLGLGLTIRWTPEISEELQKRIDDIINT